MNGWEGRDGNSINFQTIVFHLKILFPFSRMIFNNFKSSGVRVKNGSRLQVRDNGLDLLLGVHVEEVFGRHRHHFNVD